MTSGTSFNSERKKVWTFSSAVPLKVLFFHMVANIWGIYFIMMIAGQKFFFWQFLRVIVAHSDDGLWIGPFCSIFHWPSSLSFYKTLLAYQKCCQNGPSDPAGHHIPNLLGHPLKFTSLHIHFIKWVIFLSHKCLDYYALLKAFIFFLP